MKLILAHNLRSFQRDQARAIQVFSKFKCSSCGSCCNNFTGGFSLKVFSPKKIERIRASKHAGAFQINSANDVSLRMKDGKCVFFEGGKCKIYDEGIRPEACEVTPMALVVPPFRLQAVYCVDSSCPEIAKIASQGVSRIDFDAFVHAAEYNPHLKLVLTAGLSVPLIALHMKQDKALSIYPEVLVRDDEFFRRPRFDDFNFRQGAKSVSLYL